jgi:sugar phosphate isomerase/epimerase
LKTGVSTACLYPMETERSLQTLLDLGYRRFEVFLNCMEELEMPFLRELKRRADAVGGEFVSIHPFTSAVESSMLFGDYPRRTKEAFDFYRRYMAAAAFLGGKWVVIHGQPQGHGKLTDEGYWQRFGELYRLGDQEGAYPAQECVRQFRASKTPFVAGMRDYLGEQCAFVLDVKQCRIVGTPWQEMLQAMGQRLVHVHLSDWDDGKTCLLPGAGKGDFLPLRHALEEMGYNGAVITEVYRENFREICELENSLYFTKNVLEGPVS